MLRWYPQSSTVIVNSRMRLCHMARREHKRNHVYFVVNLLRLSYHQRCHDGDSKCEHKRSPTFYLDAHADVPATVQLELMRVQMEQCLRYL